VRGARITAEAVGTFMLVFIGPGAAAVEAWSHGSVGPVGVAAAFGCAILAGVYALGRISGAHFNPAVTLAFWLDGRFPQADVFPYLAAQLGGAAGAALLLRGLLGEAARAAATVPQLPAGSALIVEATLSFFLMLVITAVATDADVAGPVAGLAVGLTVAFDALMGGPLTGASMNPARSFGPALANGVWREHWIYWLGPLAGAALATRTYNYLRRGSPHARRSDA
jgi:MIP family channel proteins